LLKSVKQLLTRGFTAVVWRRSRQSVVCNSCGHWRCN